MNVTQHEYHTVTQLYAVQYLEHNIVSITNFTTYYLGDKMASAEQILCETKGLDIYHNYSISATVHAMVHATALATVRATVHATSPCLLTIIQVKEYCYNKSHGLQKPK